MSESVWDDIEFRARMHGEPTPRLEVLNGELMQEYILRHNVGSDLKVWVSLGRFVEQADKENVDG